MQQTINKRLEELYYETDSCVRCGRCTAVCPTYKATLKEPMVARGRIWLARQFVEGKLPMSDTIKLYTDLCLGCQACLTVCPQKIKVDELMGEIRRYIREEKGLGLEDRMMMLSCSHPQSFRWLMRMVDFNRQTGLLKLLPEELRAKAVLFPPAAPESFLDAVKKRRPAVRPAGGKLVGYFPGCLTNAIYPAMGLAVIEVLEQHGFTVIIPPEITCCGLPHQEGGQVAESNRLAIHTMEFFLGEGVDYIVTSCGTCGHALKEYATTFAADPEWAERAKLFGGKCYDIVEFLVDVAGIKFGPVALGGITVTYHESCHLNRRLKVSAQPRKLLDGLPGATFTEMPHADWCCGAAGSFSIKHPTLAKDILQRKTEDIAATGATVVTAGCPSCLMQLDYGRREFGGGYTVCHPVELLARTYRK